jgi:hypothetical protein
MHYSPKLFNIIFQYIHLLPLWTGVIISIFPYFNLRNENFTRLTNNYVENWFGQIKNNLLQKRSWMPSVVTSRMFRKIESEYEEKYKNENIELNKISDDLKKKRLQTKKRVLLYHVRSQAI